MTKSRWRALAGVLGVLAIVAFAAACGGSSSKSTPTASSGANTATSGSPSAGASSTTSADQPVKGGSVTIQYLEFQSFDPHFSSFAQDIGVQGMVWRGLYTLDVNNKVQSMLASGPPQVSADGMTYTVKLKSGLKWSDGSPLTAKDFVLAIQRTCNPDNAGQYEGLLYNIVGCDAYYNANSSKPPATDAQKADLLKAVGVSATDDTTVVYKLIAPQATFGATLALWMTWPVPSSVVPGPADKWPAPDKLLFDGPFKVQSYTQKDNMVLVRNDNFAGPHPAYLDKVTLKFIDDTETADNAFRTGELSAALANTANLDVIKKDPTLSKELHNNGKSANTIAVQVQMKHPPLDNPKVRLALSQAIDRKTLNDVVFKGANVPTTSWIPGDVLGQTDDLYENQVGYNPTAAKQTLADAGFAGGKGIPELDFLIRDTPANNAMAQFLQQAWKDTLGINIKIEVVDSPTRSKRFKEESFDLYPGGWNQDYPDPENWILSLFDTGGALNHYNCSDPKIDDLFKKAKTNLDNASRIDQYKQINQEISTTLCGVIPIYHQGNWYLISPKLHGSAENQTSQDRVIAGDWNIENWWVSP